MIHRNSDVYCSNAPHAICYEQDATTKRSWTLPTSPVTTSVYPTSKDESSDDCKKSLPSLEGSRQWISSTDTTSSTTFPPLACSTPHHAPLAPHQSQEKPVYKSSSLSLKSIVPHGSSEIQNDGVSVIFQTPYSTDAQTSQFQLASGIDVSCTSPILKPRSQPHLSNKLSSTTHSAPPPLMSFLDRSETQPRPLVSGNLTVGRQPETFSHSQPDDTSGAISRTRTDISMQATRSTHREHHSQSPTLASAPILKANVKREIEPSDDVGTGRSRPTKPVVAPSVLNKPSSPDQLSSRENTYKPVDPSPGADQQRPNTDVSRQTKPEMASPTYQATPDVNKPRSPDRPYSWEYPYTPSESNSGTGQQKPNTDASSSTCSDGVKEEILTLTASERPKRVDPSTKMRAALKVVNDLIEKSSTISELGNTAKAANGIIQREWFQISSTPSADPHIVEDYLDHFEEMSSTLLTYVVNMADKAGNTAMHYALSQGNFDVVSILLDSKVCNINLPNAAGYTAVMLVSLAQIRSDTHRCVLQRFLADADVNVRAQQHGQTALMLAVSHNRLDMVQLLIEGGADLNIQDDDGSTALMCAAEHGHAAIVQFLINQPDTDLNIKDVDGLTALDIALDAGHKDVGILLYAHKHFSRNNSPYSSLRGRRSKSSTPTTRTASTPPPRTPSSPLPVRAPPRHSHD